LSARDFKDQERRIAFLLGLGTSLSASISVAMSHKGAFVGPWRLARTPATQTGIAKKWLKAQGLLSAELPWVNIHYPAHDVQSL
jgi:RNA-directed DNA polymerase